MFADIGALILAYAAMSLAGREPTGRHTFGLYRAEILAAFVNAQVLLVVALYLGYEAVRRFRQPVEIHTGAMLWVTALWLGNLCWSMRENSFQALEWRALDEVEHLVETARSTRLVVVTNEVGQGIVPESPLGRLFRDVQGWINQAVAQKSDVVYQMVAGIPIPIKSQKGGNETEH